MISRRTDNQNDVSATDTVGIGETETRAREIICYSGIGDAWSCTLMQAVPVRYDDMRARVF